MRLLKNKYSKLVKMPSHKVCSSPRQTLIEYYSDSSSANYFNKFDESELPHCNWLKRKTTQIIQESVEKDVDSAESELCRAKKLLYDDLGEAITCYQENLELGLLLV